MTTAIVRTILSYKNYDDWKSQITYLLAEDLWDIIDEGTDECPKTEDEEKAQSKAWKKKDAKALYAIQNSCGDDTYELIKYKTTAKQAWDTLSKRLEKPGGPSNEKEYMSVGEAYQPEVLIEETPGAGHEIQETFVKYVKSNDWDNAINLLSQHPQLGSAIVKWGGTALHYAIRKRCSVRHIQQLVELTPMEHLEIPAAFGYTALYYLIRLFPERVEVAKCMAQKNPNLLTILPRRDKKALVAIAQANTKGEGMARYFYSLTPPETIKVVDATHLISHGFRLQRFGIRIKPLPPLDKEKHESDEGHLISSGMSLFQRLVANLQTLLVNLGTDRIYQMKLVHERVQQFLPLMCKIVREEGMSDYQKRKLEEALCVAAERGHAEYITHFLKYSSYPIFRVKNEKYQSLFQITVECRQYNAYNIICEFFKKLDKDGLDRSKYGIPQSDGLKEALKRKDNLGNNMLHTVARITPLSQIDHIQGAVLQMQRELQWFKEVESIVDPIDCESINIDDKTPRKIFTENHKELGKEAEKSMKETATSCTVVGALIVTIMFAAAFTVPGGNEEKRGLPQVFTTFIVADAISLFSSTTSVIMFLGILTSRYSQDDFHKSLPTKMIIGLFTLFLSIATMMIVFSCGLYIILDGKSSIVIPSILFAGVPVASFIWMQFPLLVDLSISTFGQGIFDRKQKKLF